MKVIVSGALLMNGMNASKIILTNAKSAHWNGIVIQRFNISATPSKILQ